MLGRQQRMSAASINVFFAFKNSSCTLSLPAFNDKVLCMCTRIQFHVRPNSTADEPLL